MNTKGLSCLSKRTTKVCNVMARLDREAIKWSALVVGLLLLTAAAMTLAQALLVIALKTIEVLPQMSLQQGALFLGVFTLNVVSISGHTLLTAELFFLLMALVFVPDWFKKYR
jgi:hypothetical protein